MHCPEFEMGLSHETPVRRDTLLSDGGLSLPPPGGVLVSVWCGGSRRDVVVAPKHVDARRRAVKRLKEATGATRAALGGVLMAAAMAITTGSSMPAALAAVAVPPQAVVEEEEREQTPDDWAAMLLSAAPMFSAPEPVGAVATAEDIISDPWFSAPVPSLSMPEQQAMLEYLQGGAFAPALSTPLYQLVPREHVRALRAHRTHRGRTEQID
jgi:hypothetical protein